MSTEGDDGPAFARSRTFDREREKFEAVQREREVRAAERAARWAMGSMVVALVSLAVAVAPYVIAWLR